MDQVILKGGCLCGAVRYEAAGTPTRFYHCHCSRCRKVTGTGHATNLFLQPGALRWLRGEESVRAFKVPEAKRFANCFCAVCGSRVPRQSRDPDFVMIPAGSLDDPAPLEPQARIFQDSRTSWSCADDLPGFAEYPPA